MKNQSYKDQVALLLTVLPEVAKEENLAMHGGTAINLFLREMPRVSVDIDLTYVPIEDRETSLQNITAALERIKARVEKLNPEINVDHKIAESKLLISKGGTLVKVEVNQIMRGAISPAMPLSLSQTAQKEFEAYCEMPVVPIGQLHGGKICAALDRQHPRDVFDVKHILQNEGFTKEIKTGLLYALLSSARPLHELLNPHLKDQRDAMENQFDGMTNESFTYEDFEATRVQLVKTIQENLTEEDIAFLLAFNRLKPDWTMHDYQNFPSVRWKIQNLERLRESQPEKFKQQCDLLEELFIDMKTK